MIIKDWLQQFHDAGFGSLWYAHPGGSWGREQRRFGPRWYAGVWTGPDKDLICVCRSATRALAEEALSPGGWTPEEAVELAVEKRVPLLTARGRCPEFCENIVTGVDRQPCPCGHVSGHDGDCFFAISNDAPWSPKEGEKARQ